MLIAKVIEFRKKLRLRYFIAGNLFLFFGIIQYINIYILNINVVVACFCQNENCSYAYDFSEAQFIVCARAIFVVTTKINRSIQCVLIFMENILYSYRYYP